jgi:hypothetical protein
VGLYKQSPPARANVLSALAVAILTQQLDRNNLICVTEEDMVANNKLKTRHNIDHICFSKDWFRKVQIMAWEGMTEDGIYLSDHNGVCACLTF